MDEKSRQNQIAVSIEHADALTFPADVLILKHAQALYGLDLHAVKRLKDGGIDIATRLPSVYKSLLIRSEGKVGAQKILFIGTPRLEEFTYASIKEFGRRALKTLSSELPNTRHLALTVHGPGFGLDEIECFASLITGLKNAISADEYPPELQRISVVEFNARRAGEYAGAVKSLLPEGAIPATPEAGQFSGVDGATRTPLEISATEDKPHVFVAMPIREEMEDLYHYGVRPAVNAAGFLCERPELSAFTGDIMEWIKGRIATATLVVANLSGANPNVYLEVGYAWRCGRPMSCVRQNLPQKLIV